MTRDDRGMRWLAPASHRSWRARRKRRSCHHDVEKDDWAVAGRLRQGEGPRSHGAKWYARNTRHSGRPVVHGQIYQGAASATLARQSARSSRQIRRTFLDRNVAWLDAIKVPAHVLTGDLDGGCNPRLTDELAMLCQGRARHPGRARTSYSDQTPDRVRQGQIGPDRVRQGQIGWHRTCRVF